jgi:hypothetical protein
MGDDYPHFRDFTDKKYQLEGEKKNIEEIFNIEILITGYRIGKSKYYSGNDVLTLQFKLNGKLYIIFTSSDPLIKQAKESNEKKKIPFYTTIIRQGNYYTMT